MQPWTYSTLDSFTSCPKQFYHLRVARDVVDRPWEHREWGERVHKAFEHRILQGTPLPEGMTQWEPVAGKLASIKGDKFVEHKLAVDDSFAPAPYRSSWSRGIIDLLVVDKDKAGTFDYKTGKRRPSNQLSLYAGYVFAHYPEVKTVATGFVWLKEKKVTKEVYERADAPRIWQYFLPTVRKLELAHENNAWPARPSGLCKGWCPVTNCVHYKKE